jgi:very-short-patch-repair endonuclease
MADKTDVYLLAQLGLVTIEQTIECGMSDRTRERRCASGEWQRVHRRVYRSRAYPSSHEQRLLAAALAAGSTATISHYAAADVLGVERFRSGFVELSVQQHRNLELTGCTVHRIADLTPADMTRIGPIPVTTHARTLVDLGAVARPWLVRRALEQWLREGHVTVPQVRATLDRVARRGRAGAGVLREVLDTRALRFEASDADAEVVLAEALQAIGAPPPVYHFLIPVGLGQTFEIDFAYPEAMLLIEVDGYSTHTTPDVFESDRIRDNVLVDRGFMVRRYTRKRVLSQAHVVAAEIDYLRRKRLAAAC